MQASWGRERVRLLALNQRYCAEISLLETFKASGSQNMCLCTSFPKHQMIFSQLKCLEVSGCDSDYTQKVRISLQLTHMELI